MRGGFVAQVISLAWVAAESAVCLKAATIGRGQWLPAGTATNGRGFAEIGPAGASPSRTSLARRAWCTPANRRRAGVSGKAGRTIKAGLFVVAKRGVLRQR